jgi:sulfoxide reductase heme-binding subunit YedZ
LPGALLLLRAAQGDLGPNPIAEGLDACGELAVKVLLLSLACTPARIVLGVTWPMRVRKALGLLAFTYASLHLGVYVVLDRGLDVASIGGEVVKRPFIAIGMIAYALLVPLAVTSTKRMLQRLGAKRWQRLHKLVYGVAALAIVHYVMRQKESVKVPVVHGAVLAFLFAVRIWDAIVKRRRRAAPRRAAAMREGPPME